MNRAERLTATEKLWRAIPESAVQQTLTDTAEALASPWHHETDSRKSRRGWPDLAMPLPPVLWIVECKKELEPLEPEQVWWSEFLRRCTRVEYRIARPSNVGRIAEELRDGSAT